MSSVILSPSDRISMVGKTGSGKTTGAVVIASLLVPENSPHWEVWFLDTKRDPKDQAMFKAWGYGKRHSSRKHIVIDPANGMIEWQIQHWCKVAMERRNVLLLVDEYAQAVLSTLRAGPNLDDVHTRGRGIGVGMLGLTQEPVLIPRKLLSQATHVFIFDLSYPADIKYARSLCPEYHRPPCDQSHRRGAMCNTHRTAHSKGFYYAHIDGDANWHYYPHIKAWHDMVTSTEKVS